MNRLFLLLCIAVSMPAVAAPETYLIDTKGGHASINFRFNHIGISWLTGMFEDFSGSFVFDPENPANSSVEVEIDTASLDSNHGERDKHVRSDDFLHVDKFPTARFVSTRVEPTGENTATVYGDLTLYGTTREIAIDAKLTGKGDDPWGGHRAGFEGTTTIDTKAFGFGLPPTNEVEMTLYLEGIRQ
ncbi:MAG: YceI family protein [Gammaproteobacteria bacterium]|nr:YceI family protein [Gammaproteobacteria bacterium]